MTRPIRTEHIRGLFSILARPVDGFEQTRFRRHGSHVLAALLFMLFFAAIIFERQFTGYLFNASRVEKLNIFIMGALALGLPALWMVANMAVCTLTDGEGSFSDVFVVTAYAFLPYILLCPVGIALSCFLIAKEGALLSILRFIQIGWTGFLLLSGNMVAHQFSARKTLVTALLTVLGMVIILFLMFLAFFLVQQLLGFGRTILNELTFING